MKLENSKSFSFNQMNKIVDIMQSSPSKTQKTEENVDKVLLGNTVPAEQDVIIMPSPNLLKTRADVKTVDTLKDKGIDFEDELKIVGGVAAKVTPQEMQELKKSGFLVYDNSPRQLIPDIPAATIKEDKGGKPWDMPVVEELKWTKAEELQKQGITGKGITAAIVDSGYNHPQKPLKGWVDIADGNKNPVDPNGHGTHVAGDTTKMLPDVELVGVRVMNDKGQGKPSDIVKGIEWVIKNKDRFGIDLINMSLGAGPDGIPFYMDPINKAVEQAIKQGIDVIVAAGNSGPDPSTMGSPADDPQVLTVGSALNPTTVSNFSSRGPTEDNLNKPDIISPGEFIVSWAAPNSQLDNIGKTLQTIRNMSADQLTTLLQNKPDLIKGLGLPDNVMSLSPTEREKVVKTHLPPLFKPTPDTLAGPGTSFASPEVAGIVGGLKQAVHDSTPSARKDALMKTAHSMGSQYTVTDQGAGFIDASAALEYLKGHKS